MLILSKMILSRPVMSLRTGRPVATAYQTIINPNNLKIEGFYCLDSIEKNKQLILLYQDIRDVLPAGLVVDDHEVLADPSDLVRLKSVMELEFELIGKKVITTENKKIGKVSDYAVEPESMLIKKIYVVQTLIKNLTGGSLSVDRNQIVEITSRKIIIKEPLQKIPAQSPALNPAVAPAA